MGITYPMRKIKVQIELILPTEEVDVCSLDSIADFLNVKLHSNPEYFGDFSRENILSVESLE